MKTVQAGREKLQVTPLPKVEIGEGGDTSLASNLPGAAQVGIEDPEGFFDQDLS
jgi:hypothetical protein